MDNELRHVVDALPGLVWTALLDGHVDFLNQRWCEYTGLRVDDGLGRGWQAAIHADDLPALLEQWQSILTSGQPREMEARLRRFDGEYRWFVFRTRPLLDASGQIVKWCGMNSDVEDRRRADETLRLRELSFRLIVDSIPAPVAVTTPSGEVEGVNRPTLEYFGKTFEELKDWAISDIVHPDDRQRTIAAQREAHETGGAYNVESRHRRADGVYRWFSVRGFPLRDTEGRILRWFILQIDIDDRKRAEALLAGEKQLLEMVASGRSLLVVLDAVCRLFDATVEGCSSSVLLLDRTRTIIEHAVGPGLPASYNESMEGRFANSDAAPREMLAHGLTSYWSAPILSLTGESLGTFAIHRRDGGSSTPFDDALIQKLTHIASIAIESMRTVEALRDSEARKAAILDSALDCIVTIDHAGYITEFNPAAERTFGYRGDEVVGHSLADVIIPPSFREAHRRGLARYLITGEPRVIGRHVEMTAKRADGSEFPVELAITRIPWGGPPSFTGYLRDITERKRAEERLRRSEAFLAEGEAISETGSFLWRVATNEITWSRQLYRIFELDDALPVTFELIDTRIHPDDITVFHELADRSRGDGRDFEYEVRLQMADQSVKYVHAIAHATRDQDGGLEYIGAVQNVTERRRSEEALGKVRSELAHVARVTSLGALTASIAHEVNQPLSGIITNASTCLRMLAADHPNIDGARETARRTIRDGHRASDVITRLRALFAKRDTTTESVDLNEATREVIALSSSELRRSRVILQPELADDLPIVTGDRVQLQQVILNLLLNASDAMSDVDDRPRELAIRTERDEGDGVRLTVQDSGVGLEPHSVDKLFEAFYTTKRGGMGMGLSVSRSIVESHNGRLWARPNDGPGATFSFSIPRAHASSGTHAMRTT